MQNPRLAFAFILFWTTDITDSVSHFVVSRRHDQIYAIMDNGLFLLIAFSAYGVLTGAISGSIVGGLLASFYVTGYISMPTWIPLTWAILQAVVTMIFSYSQIAFLAL
ncbi:hypothetical protein BDV3_006461 [Batrachochytrium dendrobatidis]